jgi:HEPN domain-containing protein
MSFNAEVYLAAARERTEEVDELYRARRYVLAHYLAGVAVECILRAYRYRRDPEFDARHDLYRLLHSSGMIQALRPDEIYAANAALASVNFRWANDFRYRSEADLRKHLKRIGADRGIKGNVLKENARRSMEAASSFVRIGVKAWKRS